MPLSVSAASLKTGSVKYNGSYSDRISNTESGHTSTLTAQYFYGATSSDKADMICTYSYNDPLGYKYATINNNGTVYGGANIDGKTDVQVVQTSEVRFVSSNTAVVYHGYVKSSRTGETKYSPMTYSITLTS